MDGDGCQPRRLCAVFENEWLRCVVELRVKSLCMFYVCEGDCWEPFTGDVVTKQGHLKTWLPCFDIIDRQNPVDIDIFREGRFDHSTWRT